MNSCIHAKNWGMASSVIMIDKISGTQFKICPECYDKYKHYSGFKFEFGSMVYRPKIKSEKTEVPF